MKEVGNLLRERSGVSGLPGWLGGKESACDAEDMCSVPGSGRCHWRRAWQPTLVFLPGESHEQGSLSGYSPLGHKELNTTEVT